MISGSLITRILAESMAAGSFSFQEFYFKQARRILPAAYVTIVATIIGATAFLTSLEFEALASQVIGAVTFWINFILWQQTDYFAVEAASKPLLHLWSLAIEEQYYLILPVLMLSVPSRHWKIGLLGLCVASLLACWYWITRDPTAAFYLLHFEPGNCSLAHWAQCFHLPLPDIPPRGGDCSGLQ